MKRMKPSECTTRDDLSKYVLAENVVVERDLNASDGAIETTFDFLCPNCGKRHWAIELEFSRLFSFVGYTLPCGKVNVRMPWAHTPAREDMSIYGHVPSPGDDCDGYQPAA